MSYWKHTGQIRGLVDNLYEILGEITEQCIDGSCSTEQRNNLKRELTLMMHETEALAVAARAYRKQIFGV